MASYGRVPGDFSDSIVVEENFFKDGTEPDNANEWTSYDDASGAVPVDGTGTGGNEGNLINGLEAGSTFRIGRVADFVFSKTPFNAQGTGRSSRQKRIAPYMRTKVATVSFDYKFTTNVSTVAPNQYGVFIYDDTNSQLVELDRRYIESLADEVQGQFIGKFQVPEGMSNFRVLIHYTGTNASQTDNLQINNIKVGRQQIATGSLDSSWREYPLSVTSSGTSPTKGTVATDKAYFRRIGDSIEVTYNFRQTTAGTAGTGDYRFSLPDNLSVDTEKLTADVTSNAIGIVGVAGVFSTASGHQTGYVEVIQASPGLLQIRTGDDTQAPNTMNSVTNAFSNADLRVSFRATIPIVGWEASAQISSDTGQRNLVLTAFQNSLQSIPNNTITTVIYDTLQETTGGIDLNTSTGFVTFTESGWYEATANAGVANIADGALCQNRIVIQRPGEAEFIIDRANGYSSGANLEPTPKVSGKFYAPAGTTLRVAILHDHGAARDTLYSLTGVMNLHISKIQGPQTHALPEKVAMKAYKNSPQSFTNAVPATVIYNSVTQDTHGAYDNTTGFYTVKVPGDYEVISVNLFNAANLISGNSAALNIRKNSSSQAETFYESTGTNASALVAVNLTTVIEGCVPGDLIDARLEANFNTSPTALNGTTRRNYLIIRRLP